MKIVDFLRRARAAREVVSVVPQSVASSPETLELNAKLAEMRTRPIPVVTR